MSPRRVDSSALIFGIIFLAVAGWWLLDRFVNWHIANGGWIVAGVLIAAGVIGIGRALRSPRE
jgi:hypothetical protein